MQRELLACQAYNMTSSHGQQPEAKRRASSPVERPSSLPAVDGAGSLPMITGPKSLGWTLDGYPVVDGKYYDMVANKIKTYTGPTAAGPPSISVYWHNRLATGRDDKVYAISKVINRKLTECLIRIGNMLETGGCKVRSLNATTYDVNVILETELSNIEFEKLLKTHGL